jgi:hypothetical protein
MPWAEGLLPAHLRAKGDVVQQGRITFARKDSESAHQLVYDFSVWGKRKFTSSAFQPFRGQRLWHNVPTIHLALCAPSDAPDCLTCGLIYRRVRGFAHAKE